MQPENDTSIKYMLTNFRGKCARSYQEPELINLDYLGGGECNWTLLAEDWIWSGELLFPNNNRFNIRALCSRIKGKANTFRLDSFSVDWFIAGHIDDSLVTQDWGVNIVPGRFQETTGKVITNRLEVFELKYNQYY